MKTALQELLIDLMINLEKEIGHRLNMEKFTPFLEKEKEQIIEAHKSGWIDCQQHIMTIGELTREGKEYYNQTYNQNK
jgi:hypothetical protein